MKYGLETDELEMITGACAEFSEIEEVVLFGSRARGNFRRGSDVDLAIKGSAVKFETVLRLGGELNEEVPLPYFFDVVDYQSISDDLFAAQIDKYGQVIYKRDLVSAS